MPPRTQWQPELDVPVTVGFRSGKTVHGTLKQIPVSAVDVWCLWDDDQVVWYFWDYDYIAERARSDGTV